MAGKGTMLAKVGWPAKKFYLSPEAIELLRQHCEGTPLTMSAYLDLLIKQNLAAEPYTPSKAPSSPPVDGKVLYGGARSASKIQPKQPVKKDQPFDL